MDETMALIHKRANERFEIFRLAAKQSMTPQQQARLHHLDAELPQLWDQYRREFAARRWSKPAQVREALRAA